MHAWALVLLLACGASEGGAPHAPSEPSLHDPRVTVHAVIDLPAGALPRGGSTLSDLCFDGQAFFSVPDREPRLAKLTLARDHRAATLEVATELAPELRSPWDGEGVACAADGSFYVVTAETVPRLAHVGRDGAWLGDVALDPVFSQQARGNKGLESVALSPSGAHLFYANEAALPLDGALASTTEGTLVRLVRHTLHGERREVFAYRTEPLGEGQGGDMGVSALTAWSDDELLVLERGYQPDFGNTVRVYRVSLRDGAVLAPGQALAELPVLAKRLWVDVGQLAAPPGVAVKAPQPNPLLDNYEGLAFGPEHDGAPTLWLLSDDNARSTQVARLLGLRLGGE